MLEPVDVDYASITKLNLSNKQLDVLPDLSMYINLRVLYCWNNKLTSLDNLPSSLKELYCWRNNITSLDKIPHGLLKLYCSFNNLTSLDNLPYGIKKLVCNYNQITSLNNLPQSLELLNCWYNPLIYNFKPTLTNILSYNSTRMNLTVKLN